MKADKIQCQLLKNKVHTDCFLRENKKNHTISRKYPSKESTDLKNFVKSIFLISETNDFDCEGQLGPVANPDDCSSFYLCDFEEATLQYCHESELFDETILVCNYEYLVDCGTRPKPGGSTTSTNPSKSKMIHFPKLLTKLMITNSHNIY